MKSKHQSNTQPVEPKVQYKELQAPFNIKATPTSKDKK